MRQLKQIMQLASIAVLVAGCSKDVLDITSSSGSENGGFLISALLPDNDVSTRMTFVEDQNAEACPYLSSCWSEGDAFTISPDASSSQNVSTFSIINGSGTTSGTFKCETPYKGASAQWMVYYPGSVKCDEDYNAFVFDGQIQNGNDNKDHLPAYNLMRKAYSYDAESPMPSEVSFSGNGFDQSSCMKFVISNLPNAAVVKELTVEAYHYIIVRWEELSQEVIAETDFSQTMSFVNMPRSNQLVAYMMLPPSDKRIRQNGYLKVTVSTADGTVYTTERRMTKAVTLQAGTYNTVSLKKNWVEDKGIDGTWGALQVPSASGVATPYCNFIIMGDGYTQDDYESSDGKFMHDAQKAYESIFSVEPYKGLKDYFGVYYVNVVSPQKINTSGAYLNGANNVDANTALNVSFTPNSTAIKGNETRIMHYAGKVDKLSMEQVLRSTIIVIANHSCHAGTCSLYYSNQATDYCQNYSISFVALGNNGSSQDEQFRCTIIHEAGGHGFGKLADEYTTNSYYPALESAQSTLLNLHNRGIYKNVHPFTSGLTSADDTQWADYISVDVYAPEHIGLYEGAYAVSSGFCRSTEKSIMNDDSSCYFNAISRKMIYHRVMRLSGKSEAEANASFLSWDSAHLPREGAYLATRTESSRAGEDSLLPLAPPVLRCLPALTD